MTTIFKREIHSFFVTPIGYIFLAAFLFLSAFFFNAINLSAYYTMPPANLANYFYNMFFILVLLVPILTMRLFSEEKKQKTDQLWLTSPTGVTSIVLGKFTAAMFVMLLTLIATLAYPIILFAGTAEFSKPNGGLMVAQYICYFLLSASFVSVGLFMSSVTENQIVAAFGSFGILLVLWLIDALASTVSSTPWLASILQWLSLTRRFEGLMRGVIDPTAILFYLSISAVFVFLTIRTIEKKRWN